MLGTPSTPLTMLLSASPAWKRRSSGAAHCFAAAVHFWGGEAAGRVRDEAIRLAEAHTTHLHAGRSAHARGWACEGWANVAGHGSYNKPHIHADTYWTVVYYVRADARDGGELVLHDPRLPAIEMHAPQLRFRPSGGEGAINMTPEAGCSFSFPDGCSIRSRLTMARVTGSRSQ